MASRIEDLTGRKFGRWTVLGFSCVIKNQSCWQCLCSCGVRRDVVRGSLVSGKSSSCGCLNKEVVQAKLDWQEKQMVGSKFGKLTVVELSSKRRTTSRARYWNCLCDCGQVSQVETYSLTSGHTTSCGCQIQYLPKKHGECSFSLKGTTTKASTEYLSWSSMKARCLNPKHHAYHLYGGRGVTICDRWMESFENFLEDMGRKPDQSFSIERIDNDGDYHPENCRWANKSEQANNRSTCTYLTLDGKTKTVAQWAREVGVDAGTIYARITRGVPPLPEISSEILKLVKGDELRRLRTP